MRDAFGGTVNLVIISVFIVVVLGYLAFNINYTKAFRMKNKIIAYYEETNGECVTSCQTKIKEYASSIGYSPGNVNCPQGYEAKGSSTAYKQLYCIKKIAAKQRTNGLGDTKQKHYYRVITFVNVEIPIIKNIFSNFSIFSVAGDTKALTN